MYSNANDAQGSERAEASFLSMVCMLDSVLHINWDLRFTVTSLQSFHTPFLNPYQSDWATKSASFPGCQYLRSLAVCKYRGSKAWKISLVPRPLPKITFFDFSYGAWERGYWKIWSCAMPSARQMVGAVPNKESRCPFLYRPSKGWMTWMS